MSECCCWPGLRYIQLCYIYSQLCLCSSGLLYLCSGGQLYLCSRSQLYLCNSSQLCQCSSGKMSQCSSGQLYLCSSGQLCRCSSWQLSLTALQTNSGEGERNFNPWCAVLILVILIQPMTLMNSQCFCNM